MITHKRVTFGWGRKKLARMRAADGSCEQLQRAFVLNNTGALEPCLAPSQMFRVIIFHTDDDIGPHKSQRRTRPEFQARTALQTSFVSDVPRRTRGYLLNADTSHHHLRTLLKLGPMSTLTRGCLVADNCPFSVT